MWGERRRLVHTFLRLTQASSVRLGSAFEYRVVMKLPIKIPPKNPLAKILPKIRKSKNKCCVSQKACLMDKRKRNISVN